MSAGDDDRNDGVPSDLDATLEGRKRDGVRFWRIRTYPSDWNCNRGLLHSNKVRSIRLNSHYC